MSRRVPGVLALGLLAACLAGPVWCLAKPPDLPQNLILIVHPIQLPPDLPMNGPCAEPSPAVSPCQLAPDRFARQEIDVNTTRSVLENLNVLIRANEQLDRARKHANEGNLREAAECLEKVRALCPGRFDDRCDEVATLISAQTDLTWAIEAPLPRGDGEEEAEEPQECCPLGEWLRVVSDFGRCWASPVRSALEDAAHEGYCPSGCTRADALHTRLAKDVMVDSLLKAAHLAMDDGRSEKAAQLARQAHAINPDRVEADPLVYKLHLLADQAQPACYEECAEPRKLPDHPKQGRAVELLPNMPAVDTSGVEVVEPDGQVSRKGPAEPARKQAE